MECVYHPLSLENEFTSFTKNVNVSKYKWETTITKTTLPGWNIKYYFCF